MKRCFYKNEIDFLLSFVNLIIRMYLSTGMWENSSLYTLQYVATYFHERRALNFIVICNYFAAYLCGFFLTGRQGDYNLTQ